MYACLWNVCKHRNYIGVSIGYVMGMTSKYHYTINNCIN